MNSSILKLTKKLILIKEELSFNKKCNENKIKELILP